MDAELIDTMEGDVNGILNKYGAPSWQQRITHTLFQVMRLQQKAIDELIQELHDAAKTTRRKGGQHDQDSDTK